ncbi:MAG: hypothetical protein AVDCRST_MAG11-3106, partial [uncultured Gemmatimonadaceae bacterium]
WRAGLVAVVMSPVVRSRPAGASPGGAPSRVSGCGTPARRTAGRSPGGR